MNPFDKENTEEDYYKSLYENDPTESEDEDEESPSLENDADDEDAEEEDEEIVGPNPFEKEDFE